MVSSAVRVVLRARPSDGPTLLTFASDKKGVSVVQQKVLEGRPGVSQPAAQNYQFKFDNVLASSSQEEVYEACAAEVVRGALEGFNGTIMCYGQTGAGKTFTMSGGKQSYKQRGIIPRALGHLFSEVKAMPDREAKISIQYLEIYNESLYDLLDITTQPHEISIYESSRGVVTVSGLRSVTVGSEADALALLFEGETNRVIGEHQLNRESSRSHSIFTITMELKPTGESGGDVLVSKLALVDLAGSERVSKTKSEGLVLREAGHINKSLSILEQVILGLGDRNREHVPFRSSKLTHVLKNSLGGNCRTVLVANVWSDAAQTDETLSTCRFAQRMMRVTCEVSANVVADSSARAKQLERQVAELQQELAMHDAMASRAGVSYSPYSDTQRAELRARVQDFLMGPEAGAAAGQDSIEPLELHSLRHMREILLACRHLYREALHGNGSARPPPPALAAASPPTATRPNIAPANARPPSAGSSPALPTSTVKRTPSANGSSLTTGGSRPPTGGTTGTRAVDLNTGVGESDRAAQAGGAGVAPDDARPGSAAGGGPGGEAGVGIAERLMSHQGSGTSGGQGAAGYGAGLGPGVVPPDRAAALEDYRAGPGALKAQLLADNRAKLRTSRTRAKELGLAVNAAKRELDALKAREEELKRQRVQQKGEGSQVLDAEEYDALMRIKELKGAYREHYNELQVVKSEVDYTQGLIDQCQQELLLEFTAWYEQTYGRPPGTAAGGDGDFDDMPPSPSVTGLPSPAASRQGASLSHPPSSSAASTSTPTRSAGSLPGPGGAGAAASKTGAGAAGSPGLLGAVGSRAGALGAARGGRSVPLSSLVQSGEETTSPEAMAYYNAQQVMLQKASAAHRPGSVKKMRPPATFGTGTRNLT